MTYRHILSDSGVIHAQPDESDYTVCGKTPGICWQDTDMPIVCKVCLKSIHASRAWRVATRLSELVEELHQDMLQRPGAYIHADRSTIAQMMAIVESE